MTANAQTAATPAASWTDDTPEHPLLTKHAAAPLIETRVSKVIKGTMTDIFQHFWGSERRLRLELHQDHVTQYNIHRDTPDSLGEIGRAHVETPRPPQTAVRSLR